MNRLKKKNTIIALAVLAVFVICVSIARLSVDGPFEAKENQPVNAQAAVTASATPYEEPKETINRPATIATSAEPETFNAIRSNDLGEITRLMTTRYIVDSEAIDMSKSVDVYGVSAHFNIDSYAVPYPVYDNRTQLTFDTFATDIRTYPGTHYSDTISSVPADLLWFVKHSTPYLSLNDAQAYYISIGMDSATAMSLTEDEIFYATQLAIWRQMNGINSWDWTRAGYVGETHPNVPILYDLLIANFRTDVGIYTDVTIAPDSAMTLKKDTLGPFTLTGNDFPVPSDATVPYTISLLADKPGLEVLIVDASGQVMQNVPLNSNFYIRFTNYSKLPVDTKYTIRIDATSLTPVRIQRTGMLESVDVVPSNAGTRPTPLIYGYTLQDQLRTSFTFTFTTTKQDTK